MMREHGLELDLGNIAWAPVNNFQTVELFDRFNGVPTLGVLAVSSKSYLFWRVMDHDIASVWLYVPLTNRERNTLLKNGDEALNGVLFNRRKEHYATVGLAYENRLFFEREFLMNPGMDSDAAYGAIIDHSLQSLRMMLDHDLPPGRREKAERAQRELEAA
jgi:hypothetical protein